MTFVVVEKGKSESMILALKIVATILTLFLCDALLYLWKGFGKWLYHDVMEWHMPTDSQGFDGCSFTSTCKYCGREIKSHNGVIYG